MHASINAFFKGYRVRLRFEGYGIDSTRDFWIHLCTTESFPINGAVRMGKRLRPPKGTILLHTLQLTVWGRGGICLSGDGGFMSEGFYANVLWRCLMSVFCYFMFIKILSLLEPVGVFFI